MADCSPLYVAGVEGKADALGGMAPTTDTIMIMSCISGFATVPASETDN
jgi:hypothetical protein